MSFWFIRGVRRRIVTTRYPRRPEPTTADLPTPPSFRADLLTPALVDELVGICPAHALRRESGTLIYDVGACTACGRCLAAAGPAARPSGEVELAARSRADLIRSIRIGAVRAGPETGGTR